jgi:hypothetical protein
MKNPDSIAKMAMTKREQGRALLLNSEDQKLDQTFSNLAIPSHRTSKHVSLDEFKAMLTSGMNIKEISQHTSKHLIAFYSSMMQGKIKLGKEDFETMYDSGVSLNEISASTGISRQHLTYLREFYGIKRKGATYIKRLAEEKPLSDQAKNVLIGSLLGDGHMHSLGYFSEKHGPLQVEYLEWKGSVLNSIAREKPFDAYKAIDKRSGNTLYTFTFRTGAHSFCYELRKAFYDENGVKRLPDNLADILNEEVLAIWYMDDGSTDWHYRNGVKEYANSKPVCKLHTESFSVNDNVLITKILMSKWGLKSKVQQKEGSTGIMKPMIILDGLSSEKMTSMLKDYSTKDLSYKFDEQAYLIKKELSIDKEDVLNKFKEKHKL